ncbi:D-glycero-alpha-D-manno-heptose-1,7-bisphosphate 7-phosphatase [Pedobacter mucosus]|uniref:D-glycero-alpha-D-manno-heptose-1,7-bisphosphate 7-phosphatase n=1 Tax=Pedobacter mucosus TaxID=2895286 RepID=UPI001EE40532|nr:HAD family hydrolase [Pedobacter mucosus]UKT62597.1 HAD family hydrolase [Pedobacter mucosus]
MATKKAIFLDKDGTVIPNIPYNVNPDLITLNDGVAKGLKLLQQDFIFIIISNQDGVAYGKFGTEEVDVVMDKLNSLCQENDVYLSGFYFCPHHPDGKVEPYNIVCDCRKPLAGMLLSAAENHDIDLSKSWMIGDILNDVEAGKSAGCRSVLIDNGNETEWQINGIHNRIPNFICSDFSEAIKYILKSEKEETHAKRF